MIGNGYLIIIEPAKKIRDGFSYWSLDKAAILLEILFYGIFELNFPTEYKFSKRTRVITIDSVLSKSFEFGLTTGEIEELNDSVDIMKGAILYSICEDIEE